MIDNQKILAVVAARGGSKGLPGKNIADLGGRPVVAWSVAAAHGSKLVDRTILSSEDPTIIAAARAANCDVPFVRPAALATDNASIADVVVHALESLNQHYDYVVLLQATCPLRAAEDIDGCISVCIKRNAMSAVTITAVEKHPHWMFTRGEDDRIVPFGSWDDLRKRRQDLPETYVVNGAVYVAKASWFAKAKDFYSPDTVAWLMPRERSVDIDDTTGLALARALIAMR